MEVWQFVLFGFAALLALRCLTALMAAHKDRLLKEQAAREEAERRAAKKKQAVLQEAPPRRAG